MIKKERHAKAGASKKMKKGKAKKSRRGKTSENEKELVMAKLRALGYM